jgi:hypothetical protein
VVTLGAVFEDLHDVAQVIVEHIRQATGIADVQVGAPREATATTEPAVRITLLYTNPQTAHRNEPSEPLPGRSRRPAPLTLSCYYLVTTSGTDGDDPVGAHRALGQVMQLYHDVPVLRLPLATHAASASGASTDLGEGEVAVTQVPVTLDQVHHIWTPLRQSPQPWVLYEVAPVQLVAPRDEPSGGTRPRRGHVT